MSKKNRSNLSSKIILMVECIILISSTIFCAISIYRARVGIRKAIQQRMLDIANCASGSVNGEVMKHLTEDQVGSIGYNKIYDTLAVFRDNVELEYVYCIKQVGEKDFIFTMDLDQVSPASYGDSVEYTDALAIAGNGTAAVDEVPYTDQWGEFYSAYSPVFDSTGKVVGIVAVDFSAGWFNDQLSSQTRSTVISYVIILLLSLLVAALLSLLTVRPFVRAQGELLEEKVRAESANHAKSDFLANMSHEIRTPINAVLGMNEMIIREDHRAQEAADGDPKAVQEAIQNIGVYAGDVKKAGHNLLAIVNNILDFSKIEAGAMDLSESPYQLSSLLNDLNNMIVFKAQDKGLDFSIDADPSIPCEICGDEVRVRQIFTNLLNNAVKYTDKGSVTFNLHGEKQDGGSILLVASVKDTGIGIRSEDKEKLFTKFQRLEMEHNSTLEGTGLGLVITQRLLDLMGGTIEVDSEYGKGSTFTVTFPQRIINATPMGNFHTHFAANMPIDTPYRESFRAPSAHILIVDDTKMNLTVVVSLLKNTLMKIDTALSGAEAVDMAWRIRYDLIFMDQRMPEMDGTEALHRIRQKEDGASAKTPVVCLTADAVIGAKERYLAEGFSDYLTKPVDNHALEKMLLKYLPEEKIELVAGQAEESDSGSGNDVSDEFSDLRPVGIDPQTGLMFCQEDGALYRSLLIEYANGWTEKKERLQKSYEAEDWHDYGIFTHSLKSTSKMIGALSLSERFAKLEAAANAEDAGTIRSEHDVVMKAYESVTGAILSLIGPDSSTGSDDGDVMEFSPSEDVIEFLPSGEEE